MHKKALLVSIEGIDGVGKTITAKRLVYELLSRNIRAIYTYEPTEGPYGKLVRKLLSKKVSWKWERALLFVLDRAWHVENFILPKLREGYVIICDRYMHSQLAYQVAEGLCRSILETLNLEFPKPDLVIYLDSDPGNAMRRIRALSFKNERAIYVNLEFLSKVRSIYMEYLRNSKFTRKYLIINVDDFIGPDILPDQVYKKRHNRLVMEIMKTIESLLRG